jgi:hypothetical protein
MWRNRQAAAAGAILCAAAGWAIYVHFATEVVPFDDAYISYRYAENMVAGRGLVYNAGERVFGSSTPLFVLWLAALDLVVPGDLATVAVRANSIGFIAAALLAGLLTARLTASRWIGVVVAAAILVNPMLLVLSAGGMEPYWFLSLALAALMLMAEADEKPRPIGLGLLVGLAILTRAEGVLLGPIALVAMARRPRDLLETAAAAAVPLGAWALFATVYYGSPIPQSVLAKATPIYLLPRTFTIEQILGNLEGWLSGELFGGGSARRVVLGSILAIALGAACLLPAARHRRAWMPSAMLIGLVAIYSIANTLYFEWYWPPVSVMLVLTVVVGSTSLVNAARERLLVSGRQRAANAVVAGAAVVLAGWVATVSLAPLRFETDRASTPMGYVKISPVRRRVLAYLAAGESIARVAKPSDSVAAPEFGALGATWRGRILDPCGLVSPQALPFLPIPREQQMAVGAGAISIDFVQATNPDWIVTLPIYSGASLQPSEWFHRHYRVEGVMDLPFEVWRSRQLVIYRRR